MKRKGLSEIARRTAAAALSAAAVLALGGCSAREASGTAVQEESRDSEKPQIGISFDSWVIERWQRDRDVFVSTAQNLGAEVNVQNANGDADEQISQIDYLIDKGMDVIVVVAIDRSGLADVIRRAKDKGIRVVCYDRLCLDSGADLYISFDNEKVGTLMARSLKEALPDGGEIFEINGSSSDNNVSQVQRGFEKELEGSGLKITYSAYCDNWLAELAFDAVNTGLGENGGKVDGVMCGNDDLAGQAIKALTEQKLAGKVAVVGQDADLAACQRIVEGTQNMSVYKSVDEEAAVAARLSVALAKKEDITDSSAQDPVTETINDGSADVPYYRIDPVAVTAANMDSVIIDGGFHLHDDVYMNVK